MYRIDNSTAVGTIPTPSAAGVNPNSYFSFGTEISVLPTQVDSDWFNAVQEEIVNVVTMPTYGTILDKTIHTQLYTIANAYLAANAVGAPPPPNPLTSDVTAGMLSITSSSNVITLSPNVGSVLKLDGDWYMPFDTQISYLPDPTNSYLEFLNTTSVRPLIIPTVSDGVDTFSVSLGKGSTLLQPNGFVIGFDGDSITQIDNDVAMDANSNYRAVTQYAVKNCTITGLPGHYAFGVSMVYEGTFPTSGSIVLYPDYSASGTNGWAALFHGAGVSPVSWTIKDLYFAFDTTPDVGGGNNYTVSIDSVGGYLSTTISNPDYTGSNNSTITTYPADPNLALNVLVQCNSATAPTRVSISFVLVANY